MGRVLVSWETRRHRWTVAFCAATLALYPLVVGAQVPADLPQVDFAGNPSRAQEQAVHSLQVWFDIAEAGKAKPPHARDGGPAERLFEAATNPTSFSTIPPERYEDHLRICKNAGDLGGRIMLLGAGMPRGVPVDADRLPGSAARKLDENFQDFQDEVFDILVFEIDCLGAGMPKVTTYIAGLSEAEVATPSRIASLRQMQAVILKSTAGLAIGANDDHFSQANRLRLLNALARNGAALASVLSQRDRTTLRTAVEALSKLATPPFSTGFAQLKDSLNSDTCDAICRL